LLLRWDGRETEPQRIRASYDVHAHRLAVGLVYLWPPSG
jgi:hypothetical protein